MFHLSILLTVVCFFMGSSLSFASEKSAQFELDNTSVHLKDRGDIKTPTATVVVEQDYKLAERDSTYIFDFGVRNVSTQPKGEEFDRRFSAYPLFDFAFVDYFSDSLRYRAGFSYGFSQSSETLNIGQTDKVNLNNLALRIGADKNIYQSKKGRILAGVELVQSYFIKVSQSGLNNEQNSFLIPSVFLGYRSPKLWGASLSIGLDLTADLIDDNSVETNAYGLRANLEVH